MTSPKPFRGNLSFYPSAPGFKIYYYVYIGVFIKYGFFAQFLYAHRI